MMKGQVVTVSGQVDPGSLGPTMTHEHLLVSLFEAAARWDVNGVMQDIGMMCEELSYFRAAGGGAVVELSVRGNGRNPEGLREISDRTGVHVVMGCGWYREPYYQPEDRIDRRSPDDLAEELVREIEDGVGSTGIRPGIIGEIGCHKTWMSAQEERVHRAAARAQRASGLAITTHSIASPIGLWQLRVFEEEGVDPSRVVIGHADSYPFLDYHLEIVNRGAFVQFDKVGYEEAFFTKTDRLIQLVCDLAERGFLEHILLSQDMCFRSELKAFGGRGYDYLLARFVPLLLAAGLSAEEVEQITVRNPQRLLTVQ